jgi:glycosyltransferase involved in cell wall biosynthesis
MSWFNFDFFAKQPSDDATSNKPAPEVSNQQSVNQSIGNSIQAREEKKFGFFDGIHSSGYLYGWAINPQEVGRSQKLYFFINKILVDSAWTWQDRPDVSDAKGVNGSSSGFYCALSSPDFFQLLLPGCSLTVAFDEFAKEPIGGNLALDDQNIPRILAGSFRAIANMQGNKPFKDVESIFKKPIFAKAIHWSDKSCILADYFLDKFETAVWGDEFKVKFNLLLKAWGIPESALEPQLIRTLYLVDTNAPELIDLKALDAAFLERLHSTDPLINLDALKKKNIEYLRLLQQHLHLLNLQLNEKNSLQFFNLCYLLAKWCDKLNLPIDLAISFLELINPENISDYMKPGANELIGKLNKRANRNTIAAASFKSAINSNDASWYSFHELGVLFRLYSQNELQLSRKFLDQSISLWIKASQLNRSQQLSFREANGFSDHFFDKTISATTKAVNSGEKQRALQVRQQNISLLKESSLDLYAANQIEPQEERSRNWIQKNNPKILFLGSKDLAQCFHYRTIQKMELLKSQGVECAFIDTKDLGIDRWQESLMGAQLLYCTRVALANNERRLLSYAKALGVPIAYDIDDLIFDPKYFPPKIETYANTIDLKLHNHLLLDCPLFSEAMSLADFVTVSTNSLADQVKNFVGQSTKIFLLPNLLGYSLESLANKKLVQDSHKVSLVEIARNKNSRIKIFYGSGTKAHKQVFYDVFLPAAISVLKEYSNVDLHLIGHFDNIPEYLLRTGRIVLSAPTSNFYDYLGLLREMDINIAILEDSLVTDAKSEIKWLEAAAFAIPSIVSPTATYRESLKSGHDVLFAKTASEWKSELEFLITNPLARIQIGKEAQKLALEKFNVDSGIAIMKDLMTAAGVLPAIKRKKRLLLCNVYFAPQSNGGATRVAETQVRGLLENYSEEYDVYVLTTSDFTSATGTLEVDQYWYRNCLVTRLSLPSNDWFKADDEGVFKFCKRFFAEYQFDLIHMHSMQVLTGSVGLAAKSMNIPYVVTLHDAWWLSRYMFLIDEFGEAVDPSNPLSGGSPKSKEETKALMYRDGVLRSVLRGAKSILAVSQKFADLYIQAGIKDVQVHDNIVEPFEVFERKPESDGKIVLGFIGGMSKHKGYHLFRQALEEGDFSNFKALIVDTSLNDGESYETVWGSTVVRFIPKVKQAEIGKLYAQMDVLVAPSIWPESFGLVTREAIRAGVWVIATNNGAIGECVEDAKNGYIMDDTQNLSHCLSRLHKSNFKKADTQLKRYTINNLEYLCNLINFYRP